MIKLIFDEIKQCFNRIKYDIIGKRLCSLYSHKFTEWKKYNTQDMERELNLKQTLSITFLGRHCKRCLYSEVK